jgi:hypothetical protein
VLATIPMPGSGREWVRGEELLTPPRASYRWGTTMGP